MSSSLYLSYHTYWAQQASVQMQTMDTIRSQPNKPVSPELHDETMSGWGFIISDEPESMSSGRQARVTVSWPTSQSHCQLADKPESLSAGRQARVTVSWPTSQSHCQLADKPESLSAGRQARVTVSWPTSALLTLTTAARARCWNQSPSILK